MSDGDSSMPTIVPCASPSSPDHPDREPPDHRPDSFPAERDHYHDHHQFLQMMLGAASYDPELPWPLAQISTALSVSAPAHTSCTELDLHSFLSASSSSCIDSSLPTASSMPPAAGTASVTGNHSDLVYDHPLQEESVQTLPSATEEASPPERCCIHNAADLIGSHEGDSIMMISAGNDPLQLHQPCMSNTSSHLVIPDEAAGRAAASSIANHECSDLEEMLDILLEKVESSAASASGHLCLSPSMINTSFNGLQGINDGADKRKRSASEAALLAEPYISKKTIRDEYRHRETSDLSCQQKQTEDARANWKDQAGKASSCQPEEGGDQTSASWQQPFQDGGFTTTWQQPPKDDGNRATWQQNQGDEADGATWKGFEVRASCLQKQGSSKVSAPSAVWAGPTLMDIQLALASTRSSINNSAPAACAGTYPPDYDDSSSAASLSLQEAAVEAQPAPTEPDTTSSALQLTDEVALLCKDDLEQAQTL